MGPSGTEAVAAAAPPEAQDFTPTLGESARKVVRNPIRSVVLKQAEVPGCLSLAGGRPISAVFPPVCGGDEVDDSLMNYGPALSVGTPELRAWAKEFVQRHHAPPAGWEKMDVAMTPGNTNAITMVLLACTDPQEPVLCEEFTYTGLTAACGPLSRRAVGVSMDADGMVPSRLREVVCSLAAEGPKPRLLYLVPHGHNPTAITTSQARRRELYAAARELGLLILEDDPYFHLGLGSAEAAGEADMPGLELGGLPHSFLSMDTDGRVCRLDSVSKVLAPGFRIGWITAPRMVTDKLGVLSEVLVWGLSGFTQAALLRCVRDFGGHDGLHKQAQRVQWAYRQRRDLCAAAFERHLSGLAEWRLPEVGMFLWLRVIGVSDAAALAVPLVERGVALVPGGAFLAAPYSEPCCHFRVSFSQLTEATAEEAARRLAAALRDKEWLTAHGAVPGGGNGEAPAAKARRLA